MCESCEHQNVVQPLDAVFCVYICIKIIYIYIYTHGHRTLPLNRHLSPKKLPRLKAGDPGVSTAVLHASLDKFCKLSSLSGPLCTCVCNHFLLRWQTEALVCTAVFKS